ncbi:plasmid replication, integration and excision activator [Saccharothrix lopnurensis]|uniref:Plasmid replication, integration and excision activator n=1 Tax=Saccharothrix lopnurensis TaxID=1670621 RepID=A0ABW1P6Q8_9PSEU
MGVEPVVRFQSAEERAKGLPPQQETDKESGLLVWSVLAIDQAAERKADAVVTVKIAAPHQPVPPEAIPGTDVRPVVFEGLTVTPWIDDKACRGAHGGERHRCRAKLGYSLRASGMTSVIAKSAKAA